VTSTWSYAYQVRYPLPAQECSSCVASFYWGNQNDFDLLDFYNGKFMGFAQASVQNPDNGVEVHKLHTTEGFGLYDISRPELTCDTNGGTSGLHNPCHNDSYADLDNAAHGHEYELDRYGSDGTTLLQQVKTSWSAACPPPGVGGTPYSSNWGNWDGGLVTELDHSNPVMVCEVHPSRVDRYTYDGSGGGPVHSATTYTYDSLGRVASQVQLANTGSTSVADAGGAGNGATAAAVGVTQQMPGLVGGDADTAMAVDGSARITGPTLTPLQGDNARSVELWLQTTYGGQQVVLDGGGWNATGQSFLMALTQYGGVGGSPSVNTPGFYVAFWGADVYLPNLNLADGRPHHLVANLSGSSLTIYVDGGTPQGLNWNGSGWSGLSGQPFALLVTPSTAPHPLWLGQGQGQIWGAGSASFTGTLDEVAVYDHALGSARVQAHLGRARATGRRCWRTRPPPTTGWTTGPAAPARTRS
jgi:Concanavalin A-like lectin/glucanases superfamily